MVWLFLLALLLGITYCFYWVAFYNPECRHQEATPLLPTEYTEREELLHQEIETLTWEDVYVTSRDGLKLHGRYYHVSGDGAVFLLFHGYRGSGVRDLSAMHHLIREMGYNTLVIDQRAHGQSQGNTMTFGIQERWDCLCWAEYAYDRFGEGAPVFLFGVSMGAATVLMASELVLPKTVVGIIADCPYSSPVAVVRKICRDIHIPAVLSVPIGVAAALIWGQFYLSEASARKAVRQTKKPILLIHGMEDKYIPAEMSRQIQTECASPCYLELFPGAAHAGSCLTDTPRYRKILEAFVDVCLGQNDAK